MKYVIVFGTLPALATVFFLASHWAERKARDIGGWTNSYYRLHGTLNGFGCFFAFVSFVLIAGFGISGSL